MTWRFLHFLNKWLYCYFDMGVLNLRASGEYKVALGFTPADVFIAFDDDDFAPGVCHATPDGFDVVLIPKGFVVVVALNSENRKLRWVAIR
jgi:transketolase C-terminal domain/subunit